MRLFIAIDLSEEAINELERLQKEVIDEKVYAALKRVGLEGSGGKAPSELSGGMQKRVGIARAVCFSPSILLPSRPIRIRNGIISYIF